MTIKRGTGREALIEATAETLLRGEQVQITEIAAAVGVSHTLIYRHFPEGGKDELLGEAYARLFIGMAEADIDALFEILSTPGDRRSRIRELIVELLGPRRREHRWARLEALAQVRSNPYAAVRIESARAVMVESFATRLQRVEPHLGPVDARAIAIIAQAMPIGVTAFAGTRMSPAERDSLAEHWSDALVGLLERDARR